MNVYIYIYVAIWARVCRWISNEVSTVVFSCKHPPGQASESILAHSSHTLRLAPQSSGAVVVMLATGFAKFHFTVSLVCQYGKV